MSGILPKQTDDIADLCHDRRQRMISFGIDAALSHRNRILNIEFGWQLIVWGLSHPSLDP